MGLIFFSDQLFPFLESYSIEENPRLDKAITRAKSIISKCNQGRLSPKKSLTAMGHVLKCFKAFPDIQNEIQQIIDTEKRKIESVAEPVLIRKRPISEIEEEEKEEAPKRRKIEQSISATYVQMQVEKEETVSRKRKMERPIESAPPLKKPVPEPWTEYTTANILSKLSNEKIPPKTSVDLFCHTLSDQTERLLLEFEQDMKGNKQIPDAEKNAVKVQVRERISKEIARLKELDPIVSSKLISGAQKTGDLFIIFSFLEESIFSTNLFRYNIRTLLRLTEQGVDVEPFIQKILSFPEEVQDFLADRLEWLSSAKTVDEVQSNFNELQAKLAPRNKDLLREKAIKEHLASIKAFINEIFEKRMLIDQERASIVEQCTTLAPVLKDSTVIQEVNVECLKEFLELLKSRDLTLLHHEKNLFDQILLQLQRSRATGVSYSPGMLHQFVDFLQAIHKELQKSPSLSEAATREILSYCHTSADPRLVLDTLQHLNQEEMIYLTSFFPEKNSEGLRVLDFLVAGVPPNVVKSLQREGDYFASFKKQMLPLFFSFSKEDWNWFHQFMLKFHALPENQITPNYELANRIIQALHTSPLQMGTLNEQEFKAVKSILSPQEQFTLASAIPEVRESAEFFALALKGGDKLLFETVSKVALDQVPFAQLHQALLSKPFPQIKAWLEECLPSTTIPRIDTMSPSQRVDITRTQDLAQLSSWLISEQKISNLFQPEQESVRTRQTLTSAFSAALEKAQDSSHPLDVIQDSYTALEEFLSPEDKFRPFLRDARRLMDKFKDHPIQTKAYVLPLLQKVLVESLFKKGLPTVEGEKRVGRLLYVADKNLWEHLSGPSETAFSRIESLIKKDLEDLSNQYEDLIESLNKGGLYENRCKEVILPQQISIALMCKDGTLNLGIADLVKEVTFAKKPVPDNVERHIFTKLKELQSTEDLLNVLESIPAPRGPKARTTINGILLRSPNSEISDKDTHVAVLTALMTLWGQQELGNCFVIAAGIERQAISSAWLLEDFKELLENDGVLKRTIEGNVYEFYGLPWPAQRATGQTVTPQIFENHMVQIACQELGCMNKKDFSIAVDQVKKSGNPITLYAVFEALQTMHDKPAEALLDACWLVESPDQNLLLRQWENIAGSMLFLPIGKNTVPSGIQYSNVYFFGIHQAFLKIAHNANLQSLDASLSTFMTKISSGILTTVPAESIPPSLRMLRACLVPQKIKKETLSWVLGIEKEGRFVPFTNENDFETYLRDTFLEWAGIAKQPISKSMQKKLFSHSKASLVNMFESILVDKSIPCNQCVANGMLCYSMWGSRLTPLFEKATVIFSPFVSLLKSRKPDVRKKEFLEWAKQIRQKHGVSEDLSIRAHATNHIFRLLPNHPTFQAAQAAMTDPFDEIKETFIQQAYGAEYPIDECLKKLDDIILWRAAKMSDGNQILKDQSYNQIVKSIRAHFKGRDTCTYGDIAKALVHSLMYEDPTMLYILCFTRLLGPDYLRQFIHFADTNYRGTTSGVPESIHYAFWLNPEDLSWKIIDIPESNTVSFDTKITTRKLSFLDKIIIPETIVPAAKELHQKAISQLDRKTLKTLQKLERKFVDSWKSLEELSSALSQKERAIIATELVSPMQQKIPPNAQLIDFPPVKQAPETWRKAFEQCENVREEYERQIYIYIQKTKAIGEEFRFRHIFSQEPALAHLMSSEEAFRYCAHDLLRE